MVLRSDSRRKRFAGYSTHSDQTVAKDIFLQWHDWIGNFCYFLLAVSYLVINIVWLRSIAVFALTLEAMYFYAASEKPLWVGIFWAAVFVAINLVQLARIYRERSAVKLGTEDKLLHQGVFANLSAVELQRIIHIGRWRKAPKGAVLTIEDKPVPEIMILASGKAHVVSRNRLVAVLRSGSLIGEISFVTKETATATVTAHEVSRVFAIDTKKLEHLFRKFPEMERAVHRVVELDLTSKLTNSEMPARA